MKLHPLLLSISLIAISSAAFAEPANQQQWQQERIARHEEFKRQEIARMDEMQHKLEERKIHMQEWVARETHEIDEMQKRIEERKLALEQREREFNAQISQSNQQPVSTTTATTTTTASAPVTSAKIVQASANNLPHSGFAAH